MGEVRSEVQYRAALQIDPAGEKELSSSDG